MIGGAAARSWLGARVLQDVRAKEALDVGSGDILQLPAILDLKAALPLAAVFLERRGADIIVDASRVQRLGGQCLQILLSAHSSWAEAARSMEIQNASPEFCAALELFGAVDALPLQAKEAV